MLFITNCKFQANTPTSVIDAGPGSPNLTVQHSTLMGGSSGSSLISASGNVVIQYNLMKDYPQHAVEISGNTNLTYKYNLLDNGGTVAGSHLNFLQLTSGGTIKLDVEFNTTYQTPQPASGEGFQFYNNTLPGTVSATLAYNTMIATGHTTAGSSPAMSYMIHGTGKTPISGVASAHDNYFDATGAYGIFYPGSFAEWKVFGNWNMVTGRVIR